MSTENIRKFNEAVAASPELRARLDAIHSDLAEKIAELSAEAGTPFTAAEFLAVARPIEAELSDEQLDSVAGGDDTTVLVTRRGPLCNYF